MRYLVCIMLLVAAGCTTQQRAIRPQSDNDLHTDLSQIQSWIPLDSSVADVQRIMEQRGFYCTTNSDHVMCSCSYSNTSRWVSITVRKGQPAVAFGDELTIEAKPPNTALEPTPTTP